VSLTGGILRKLIPLATGNIQPVRCSCGQRLFDGFMFGAIKCHRCGRLHKFIAKEEKEAYIDKSA